MNLYQCLGSGSELCQGSGFPHRKQCNSYLLIAHPEQSRRQRNSLQIQSVLNFCFTPFRSEILASDCGVPSAKEQVPAKDHGFQARCTTTNSDETNSIGKCMFINF
eukprot:6461390-Amphidinium_carterae.1